MTDEHFIEAMSPHKPSWLLQPFTGEQHKDSVITEMLTLIFTTENELVKRCGFPSLLEFPLVTHFCTECLRLVGQKKDT